MNSYEIHYIRHVVAKALKEDDLFDPDALSYDDLELAMWSAVGDASLGLVINHPDELSQFKYFDPETDAFEVDE